MRTYLLSSSALTVPVSLTPLSDYPSRTHMESTSWQVTTCCLPLVKVDLCKIRPRGQETKHSTEINASENDSSFQHLLCQNDIHGCDLAQM